MRLDPKGGNMFKRSMGFALLTWLVGPALLAQDPQSSVPGVTKELYTAVSREPGGKFDWPRFHKLMAPNAVLRPQVRQTNGVERVMSPDAFVAWIDSMWKPTIGTSRDQGFFEHETNIVVEQYGDVAHAFSTYAKGPYTPRRVLRHGINSIQLVRREGRWYITSITWDEENTAGELPAKYRGQ